MTSFSRFAVVAALVAGFSGVAHAQPRHAPISPDRYDALSAGRSVVVDRPVASSGAVSPSESQTVMGLRVPR